MTKLSLSTLTRRSSKISGFSLVETLVILVIIAILAGFSGTALFSWMGRADLKRAARTIASLCQTARIEAIKRNTQVAVVFNGAANTCSVYTNSTDGLPAGWNTEADNTLLRRFALSDIARGSISFGSGTATKKPNSADNIVNFFPPNGRFVFNSRGGSNALGTVYVQDSSGNSMAIRMQSMSGSFRTWAWQGSSWQ
ncbi:MAG: hypothetical protein EOL87_19130 [Spartobacteria bacterium]|nr:hypothetical protein [Spartobacteria bacterium]